MKGAEQEQPLLVLDCGKTAFEHYEFNRGIFVALECAGLPFSFVGTHSMQMAHADVLKVGRHRALRFPLERWLGTASGSVAFKLFSLMITVTALWRRRGSLLALYATPISHVLIALASRWTRARLVVFLHAEIEFMSTPGARPRRIGEHLMQMALRLASQRITYVTLIEEAARALQQRYGCRDFALACPHPISPRLLGRGANAAPSATGHDKVAVALVFFRRGQDPHCIREICATLASHAVSVNVNGFYCTLPGNGDPWPHIEPMRDRRPFLSRDELERTLATSHLLVMPANEQEYRFTASGLACSAAATGALVIGCGNAFMDEYARRYPTHFRVVRNGHHLAMPDTRNLPLDNLAEVGQQLRRAVELQ